MALHPDFPRSPYDILDPDIRWFPADEALRESIQCEGRCQFIQHISLAGPFHGFRVQSPVL